MPKQIYKLTEMERKVIVEFADKGALTGYHFHLGGKRERNGRTAMMSSRSWDTIKNHLEVDLKLIERIESKKDPQSDDDRIREYFWLTAGGIAFAISEGKSLQKMMKIIEKDFPQVDKMNLEGLEITDEISKLLGKDFALSIWETAHSKGKSKNLIGPAVAGALSDPAKFVSMLTSGELPNMKEILSSPEIKKSMDLLRDLYEKSDI